MICCVQNLPKLYASLLDKSKELTGHLSPTLIKNLVIVGCGILVKETVNLNKIKNHVGCLVGNSQTLPDSHYRRLTRFFAQPVAKRHLWKWLMSWVIGYIQRWDARSMGLYLTLDGTTWAFGQLQIQLLVLSVVYRGVSVPVYWIDLGKKGHSNQQERKRLLQLAAKLYPLRGMCLLADREYIGQDWFAFLASMGLFFIIRLPKGDYKAAISSGGKSYGSLLKAILRGRVVSQYFELAEHRYRLVGVCHQDGPQAADPLVLLLTNTDWSKQQVIERYRIRWLTECLFKHLKSNGFDMESLGFESRQKIRLLIAIVVALYVICVAEGFKHFGRIRRKTYRGGRQSNHASVFRTGYGVVVARLLTIEHFVEWLLKAVNQKMKVPKPAV